MHTDDCQCQNARNPFVLENLDQISTSGPPLGEQIMQFLRMPGGVAQAKKMLGQPSPQAATPRWNLVGILVLAIDAPHTTCSPWIQTWRPCPARCISALVSLPRLPQSDRDSLSKTWRPWR